MSGVLPTLSGWLEDGRVVALATVTAASGSTPRGIGARMAVREDGEVAGSISASCVESEVHHAALDVIAAGTPVLARFGLPDPDGLGASLLCGGELTVRIERLTAEDLPRVRGELDQELADRPRLLVYGAVDIADALCRAGSVLGLRVTVCDARPVFVSTERFPAADEVVRTQPARHLEAEIAAGRVTSSTAVVSLTHDERVETPLLVAALGSPARYVGALGSRRTHTRRLDALQAAGVADGDLERLHGPVGLDLGGLDPAEVALSILAEIVATRHGGTGRPLRSLGRAEVHPGAAPTR